MKLSSVGEVIARRRLYLRVEDCEKEIQVVIGRPESFDDGRDFYCPYLIQGLGSERIGYAGGIDAIQAFQLALVQIGARLHASKEAKYGRLRWEGSGSGDLGFPLPDVLKDEET